MFIDTHAHLFSPEFKDDLEEVISRSKESGIDCIIVPATDIKTSRNVIDLINKYDFIYGAVGVHPHETKDWDDNWLHEIEVLASNKKIVAIGEIGLDYFYDFSPKEQQIKAFKAQLDLAVKLNLPVVVHNRDSNDDMMEIIRSYAGTGLRAQFHCFNGTMNEAIDYIRMHHFVSFTGNITFNKFEELRKIVSAVDINNFMIETDSPYMAPVPFRGKRNEPSHVTLVAQKIAELRKMPVEDIAKITSYNAFKFFGVGKQEGKVYTYLLDNSLYINVTNRCNADCIFCKRKTEPYIGEFNLQMTKSEEPPAEIYISEIGDPSVYKEIVFCGYGEPTIRWDVVKKIARYVKDNGGYTRLNTNGHGNYINKKDITPEMKHLIDTVSISLNAIDPRHYGEMMRLDPMFFNEMINFARNAKVYSEKVIMSVVNLSEVDIEKARKIAEEKVGAEFRVREFF